MKREEVNFKSIKPLCRNCYNCRGKFHSMEEIERKKSSWMGWICTEENSSDEPEFRVYYECPECENAEFHKH